MRLRFILPAILATASCLIGNISYQLHVLHVEHSHHIPLEASGNSHTHHEDDADHDPADHSHELVPPSDAIKASGVSAPPLVVLAASSLANLELVHDSLPLLPPKPHPRASPAHLLHSHLNL